MQVEDTLIAGYHSFLEIQMSEARVFEQKPCTVLSSDTALQFNGLDLRMDSYLSIIIDMPDHTAHLDLDARKEYETQQYVKDRAKGAYIFMVNRPYLAFEFAKAGL